MVGVLCVWMFPWWSLWGLYEWLQVKWGMCVLCKWVQVVVGWWGKWIQVTLVQVEVLGVKIVWEGV